MSPAETKSSRRGADDIRDWPRRSSGGWHGLKRWGGGRSPRPQLRASSNGRRCEVVIPAGSWRASRQPSASHHYGAGRLPAVRLPRSPCQACRAFRRDHTHFSPHLLTTTNDNCPQLFSGEDRGFPCGAMVFTSNDNCPQLSSQNQRVGGSIPSRRTISAGHRPAGWQSSSPGGPPNSFLPHFCPSSPAATISSSSPPKAISNASTARESTALRPM